MPTFRCYNCPDRKRPGFHREFEADKPLCPKCHAGAPAVIKLVDVHMLVPHEKGPFEDAATGQRRQLACMPERDVLAIYQGQHFSATEDAQGVTCPECRRHAHWLATAKELEGVRPGFRIEPGECC